MLGGGQLGQAQLSLLAAHHQDQVALKYAYELADEDVLVGGAGEVDAVDLHILRLVVLQYSSVDYHKGHAFFLALLLDGIASDEQLGIVALHRSQYDKLLLQFHLPRYDELQLQRSLALAVLMAKF